MKPHPVQAQIMEAIERFEIVFDNQHASYLEGQEVKGQVEVDLNEDTVIESKVNDL